MRKLLIDNLTDRYSLYILVILLFLPLVSHTRNLAADSNKGFSKKAAFIENKGQITDQKCKPNTDVLFLLNTPGMNVQLRIGGFSYDLYQHADHGSFNFHRIDFNLAGFNPDCEIIKSGQSDAYLNYYTTGTPISGVTRVPSFQNITYRNIYHNIDLEFLCDAKSGVKYNFVIHKGGKISDIRMDILGAENVTISNGKLMLKTSLGLVEESIPSGYFIKNGEKTTISPEFQHLRNMEFGISASGVPEDFFELVIDPVPERIWATYYGGSSTDWGKTCAVDSDGNVYLSGETTSVNNIATSGVFQTTLLGTDDAFLAKFNSTGVLQWGTYAGGPGEESPMNCAVDAAGNIYLSGSTLSLSNISTPGSHQTVRGGSSDAYLMKFTPDGQRIWGTYYGGSFEDLGARVVTDDSNHVYLSGKALSPNNISTPGAFQIQSAGGDDAFLVKFDSSGQRLWGTYFGGNHGDNAKDCAVSKNGYVYITGGTSSDIGLATPGSFQSFYGAGNRDGFLACFNPAGQRLWATYYGGNNIDECAGVAADTLGNASISGFTRSPNNISSVGAFQEVYAGNSDLFLARFSPNGVRRWGTYYGGTGRDSTGFGSLVAIDDSCHIYLPGKTNSSSGIATSNGYQKISGGDYDCFLVKFDSAGQRIWGTYYGGPSSEDNGSAAVGPSGALCLTGTTSSEDGISTVGSHQEFYAGGGGDVFLVKFQNWCWVEPAEPISGPVSVCQGTNDLNFTVPVIPAATGYQWNLPSGFSITGGNNTNSIVVSVSVNTVSGTVSVFGTSDCINGEPSSLYVNIHPRPVPVLSGSVSACAGTTSTFSVVAGQSFYQWGHSPGCTVVGGGSQTDTTMTVLWDNSGNQWISVNYTDVNGCDAFSPTLANIVVEPKLPVAISITNSATNICSGTTVIFNAIPVNQGSSPFYQWNVNANNAGNNNPTFSYVPANGDLVICILTSSATCTLGNPDTSDSITMTVNTSLPAGVSVSAAANPFCAGSGVTYTATPVNGGIAPSFLWIVNGVIAADNPIGVNTVGGLKTVGSGDTDGFSGGLTFTYLPQAGDSVWCVMTSNLSCVTMNPAISNKIFMVAAIKPTVSFVACNDVITTVDAKPFRLKGGTPLGGVYSGPGVNSVTGIFTPSVAGTGIKTIKYSYTNVATCSDEKSISITVLPAPNFTCGNLLTDVRDGKQYKTFALPNGRCWMSSNLEYGMTIDEFKPQTDNCISEHYIVHSSLLIAHSFYQWDELMQYQTIEGTQGLCPPAWHVPTSSEWDDLLAFYNGPGQAGGPMKDSLLAQGFQSVQTGFLYQNNLWSFISGANAGAMYWTSTASGNDRAVARGLNVYNPSVSRYSSLRSNGFGVRCCGDF